MIGYQTKIEIGDPKMAAQHEFYFSLPTIHFDGFEFCTAQHPVDFQLMEALYLAYKARRGDHVAAELLTAFKIVILAANGVDYWPVKQESAGTTELWDGEPAPKFYQQFQRKEKVLTKYGPGMIMLIESASGVSPYFYEINFEPMTGKRPMYVAENEILGAYAEPLKGPFWLPNAKIENGQMVAVDDSVQEDDAMPIEGTPKFMVGQKVRCPGESDLGIGVIRHTPDSRVHMYQIRFGSHDFFALREDQLELVEPIDEIFSLYGKKRIETPAPLLCAAPLCEAPATKGKFCERCGA